MAWGVRSSQLQPSGCVGDFTFCLSHTHTKCSESATMLRRPTTWTNVTSFALVSLAARAFVSRTLPANNNSRVWVFSPITHISDSLTQMRLAPPPHALPHVDTHLGQDPDPPRPLGKGHGGVGQGNIRRSSLTRGSVIDRKSPHHLASVTAQRLQPRPPQRTRRITSWLLRCCLRGSRRHVKVSFAHPRPFLAKREFPSCYLFLPSLSNVRSRDDSLTHVYY